MAQGAVVRSSRHRSVQLVLSVHPRLGNYAKVLLRISLSLQPCAMPFRNWKVLKSEVQPRRLDWRLSLFDWPHSPSRASASEGVMVVL